VEGTFQRDANGTGCITFIDTIKLIAYRAESALAGEIREALARDDDGRALL
jgi:hypothetical protein